MTKKLGVAGVILIDNKVLLLKRPDNDHHYPGQWCFPGGKAEEYENRRNALKREIYEETGLRTIAALRLEDLEDDIHMCSFYFTYVEGQDVVLSKEHTEYKFVGKDEVKEMESEIGEMTFKILTEVFEIFV